MSKIKDFLQKILPILEARAQPESGYGYFLGGDPRNFSPDAESCSQEELKEHKEACTAAEQAEALGNKINLPCKSRWIDGNTHITMSDFGIGGYTYTDLEALELLQEARLLMLENF